VTGQSAGRYVAVNGLSMYYEVHGAGKPLVLLHGGFGVVGMFEPLVPQLAATRQVIAVELQGHGHTADVDRLLSFEQMADDVAALLQALGLAPADILGYSLGGGVALQTTIRHPESVRKLVVVSAPCRSDGWYAHVLAGMRAVNADAARAWIGSPMHQAYASVAPRPEDWTTLADKTGRLLQQAYDWSGDVAAMRSPTMIVMGDADGVRADHAVEFFRLLGGGKGGGGWDGSGMPASRLGILPATTHYDILASPVLGSLVTAFLDAPLPQES
jgi:pimeloyl-ACP methyl ester carboxylesterase